MKHLAQHPSGFRHLWWLVTLLVLLMASYVVAARELMRLLPQWRAPLVTELQQRSGLAVTIGGLSGHMRGLTPVFELDNVQLAAATGKPEDGVSIRRLTLTPDLLMSLLHWDIWLRDLHLTGLRLAVDQNPDGRLQLQGFPNRVSRGDKGLAAFLKLLYRPKQLLIDDAQLTLKLKGLPALSSQAARLEMVTSGEQHQLALRLKTRQRPLSLMLRMHLDGNAVHLAEVNASGWLNVRGDNLQHWLPAKTTHRVGVQQADGSLSAWLKVSAGKLTQSTLSLDLAHLLLGNGKQHWQANNVKALAAARRQNAGYRFGLKRLDFDTTGGHWHSGAVHGSWNGLSGKQSDWVVQLTEFHLGELSAQLAAWPFALPKRWQQWQTQLRQLRPQAHITNLYVAAANGKLSRLSGHFAGAAVKAVGKSPGISGLSGWFDGSPAKGVAALDAGQLGLDLPLLYDHPLTASVSGALRWFHNDAGLLRLETGMLSAANADASGRLVAGATLVPGQVPLLHLLAFVASDHADKAKHYIPTRKLPSALSHWLTTAIGKGQLKAGRFLYEGPVHINPERQQDRTQQMQFQVHQGHLKFLPDWPELSDLTGSILVDGRLVFGHRLSGEMYQSHFQNASFRVFDDAPGGEPQLQLKGDVKAPATDLGRLLHDTPLAKRLPAELQAWQPTAGKLNGGLALEFGLKHHSDVTPQVTVDAQAEEVRLANSQRKLQFNGVSGRLHFDLQKGISSGRLKADWLGQPITAKLATADGAVGIDAQGKLSVAALQQWLGADWMSPASGKVDARVRLELPWHSKQAVSLAVNSDLKGVVIALPAPLGKPAGVAKPLAVKLQDGRRLQLRYGTKLLAARLRLANGRLTSGRVHLGSGAIAGAPSQGLVVNGYLPRLDAAPWGQWLAARAGTASARLPSIQLSLGLGTLSWQGAELHNAHLKASSSAAGGWRLSLASQRLGASAELPAHYEPRGKRPLTLVIDHLDWPASIASTLDKTSGKQAPLGGDKFSPEKLPIANVRVKQVSLARNNAGSWSGELRPLPGGIKVEHLKGQWRHADITGVLTWVRQQGHDNSHFKGNIKSHDLKALQKSWGVPPVVLSDAASAKVDLGWAGSPLGFNYRALKGSAAVDVGKCRLPHMDNNNPLLRLLGVLNVGSIARRLRFDFSDLYRKGLSCDSIKGNFVFDRQTLKIQQLHLESPSADIKLDGTTNLKTQQLDAAMTVELPLSSNLYAGCLAGPVACAGIFVFDRLFGNKLEKAAALDYHIGGSWKHPEVKK